MLLRADDIGGLPLAADLAALLSERDLLRGAGGSKDADIRSRLDLVRGDGTAQGVDRAGLQRARRTAKDLTQQVRSMSRADTSVGARISPSGAGRTTAGAPTSVAASTAAGAPTIAAVTGAAAPISGLASARSSASASDSVTAGVLLAFAYPDRIGRRRAGGDGARYTLANGRGAHFAEVQNLAKQEFIVAVDLDDRERDARILLAASLTREEIEEHLAEQLQRGDSVEWDSRGQAVMARRFIRLGALVVDDKPLQDVPPDAARAAMLEGVRSMGIEVLPWTRDARDLQARMEFARGMAESGNWPAVSDEALAATLHAWLFPWLDGITRRDHLARLFVTDMLRSLLPWEDQRRLDELAPTHLRVPSGSNIRIDYLDESAPVVSVRLQEVFGLDTTPRLGGNRIPITFKLLSPAQRPVQVTRDLASFWRGSYADVRKDMRGRYPKHYWPTLQELEEINKKGKK